MPTKTEVSARTGGWQVGWSNPYADYKAEGEGKWRRTRVSTEDGMVRDVEAESGCGGKNGREESAPLEAAEGGGRGEGGVSGGGS